MLPKINHRVLYTLFSAGVIIIGALAAIQYAKGNFRVTKGGYIAESGLLSANSFPPGAELYVNDKLVSATDDTIYLEPGEYNVKIVKEGYSPWEKTLHVQPELVSQTNAVLFPRVPTLTPLTFTGVENISPSPDGQKILYHTASASAEPKNGLYILELTNNLLSIQKGSRQLTDKGENIDLSAASIIWSPDSSEFLLSGKNQEVLIEASNKVNLASLSDVTFQKKSILSKWQEEMYIRERQFLEKFPDEVIAIATQSAQNAYLSPDKERLFYTATQEVSIPSEIVPPVPATNDQPEERDLKPGNIYVYDRKEDKNFLIGKEEVASDAAKLLLATDLYNREPLTIESSPSAFQSLQASTSSQTAKNFGLYHTSLYANTFQWFPDSKHLIYTTTDTIHIMEYDGTNDTTVYSGPFANNFVYPWPDGSKLIILTSFSPNSPLNLYAIDLK